MTYVQVLNRPNYKNRIIKLDGLEPEYTYVVEGEKNPLHGDTLMSAGLIIENMWGDFKSKLIHLVRKEKYSHS